MSFGDNTINVRTADDTVFRVKPSTEQNFVVYQNGTEVETDSLLLRRGQRVALKIEVVDAHIEIVSSDANAQLRRKPVESDDRPALPHVLVTPETAGGQSTNSAHQADGGLLGLIDRLDKGFPPAERATAEELLKKAQALEPDNAEWSKRLGRLYRLEMKGAVGDDRRGFAAKSMAQFERAVKEQKKPSQVYDLLPDLAEVSLEAGSAEKAAMYAHQLLDMAADFKDDWNTGNAIHQGNLVLGRLALQAGDIEQAKSRLLEAGRTPGSPQLNSFGPDMTLAKELLEKEERDVVVEYLQLCKKFWRSNKLEVWIAIVEGGQTPDFGANQ